MLHAIYLELQEALKARGVPFDVLYGPFPAPVPGSSAIVFDVDATTKGQFRPAPSGAPRNPSVILQRALPGVVRVYAQSTKDGAADWDHRRVAERVVDQIVASLRRICVARREQIDFQSAGLMSAQELDEAGIQTWPGVVHETKFQVWRGVTDSVSYTAEAADTKTLAAGGVTTSLDTSDSPGTGAGLPSADVEIIK